MKAKSAWLAAVLAIVMGLSAGCGTSGQQPAQQPAAGKKLSLVLDTTKDRETEMQAVAGYLQKVGIDAQVRTWEWNALKTEILKGARDAYATDWGSATFSPFDLAIPKLRTKDRGNYSFYSNPEVDKLFDDASSTVDAQRGRDDYYKVQDLLYKDAPWIFGYYRDNIEAASVKVKGWRPSTDNRENMHKVSVEGGDSITVALRADRIVTLDPANYRDRETETVIRNAFDGLVTRTPDGEVVPEIAESWTQPDPTTYVFKLHKGVLFQNGDPLTADDVVFTFERILSPTGVGGKQSPRLGLLGPLQKVEKVDDYTVKMSLKNPSPVFLQLLVHTQIVPKKYLTQVGDATFAQKPIGAGPFKVVSAKLDSQVVLERFDRYWGGKPQLRQVVFRMMPEPSTRIAALKSGEVQIITEVPPDAIADLQQDKNIKVEVAKGTRLYEIELNNQKFTDPKVRQALNYAVDWDTILKQLYLGHAHRVSTALLPSGFGYNPDLKPYPYDPEKAKALLKEAGYSVP